jgi:hypothetical protein
MSRRGSTITSRIWGIKSRWSTHLEISSGCGFALAAVRIHAGAATTQGEEALGFASALSSCDGRTRDLGGLALAAFVLITSFAVVVLTLRVTRAAGSIGAVTPARFGAGGAEVFGSFPPTSPAGHAHPRGCPRDRTCLGD